MPDEHKVIVTETMVGDVRPVYVGTDKNAALIMYEYYDTKDACWEVEFFVNGELKFSNM